MANRNKYYCIIGIDHEDISWETTIPYSLEARLYDLDASVCVGSRSLRFTETGDANLEEFLSAWCFSVVKTSCYQFMLFPGAKLKSGDISRLLLSRAPTLTMRRYSEGHHSKTVIFDKGKYVRWKVIPSTLFDFSFSKKTEDNVSEFDKFCDFMISKVGLVTFCKHYVSSQVLLRRELAPKLDMSGNSADYNPVSSTTATLEYDFGMNSGGRVVSKYPYEVMPVIGVDVNSLYTQLLLENTYSKTKLRKVKPLPNYDYTNPKTWKALKLAMDSIHGVDNWQMRVWLEVEDAYLHNIRESMSMHDSKFAKKLLPDDPHYAAKYTRFSGQMMFFINEIPEFLEKYKVKGLKIRLWLYSFCSKMSLSVREKAYSLFRDAKSKKKDPNQAATAKILKNCLAGYFEMNPTKYTSRGLSEDARDVQVCARMQEGMKHGNFTNILSGSEITHHGRTTHRMIQDFFESRGLEAVYGNTDSLYFLCRDGDERLKIMETVEEFNNFNYNRLKKHCGKFRNWIDMHPRDAVGGLKVEFEGRIIHGGINRLFKADSTGNVVGGSFSGSNVFDIIDKLPSKRIEDITRNMVIKNVPTKVDRGGYTEVNYIDWKF